MWKGRTRKNNKYVQQTVSELPSTDFTLHPVETAPQGISSVPHVLCLQLVGGKSAACSGRLDLWVSPHQLAFLEELQTRPFPSMLINSTLTLSHRTFVAGVRRSPRVTALVAEADQLRNHAHLCCYICCRSRLAGVEANSIITSNTYSHVADMVRRVFLHLRRAWNCALKCDLGVQEQCSRGMFTSFPGLPQLASIHFAKDWALTFLDYSCYGH